METALYIILTMAGLGLVILGFIMPIIVKGNERQACDYGQCALLLIMGLIMTNAGVCHFIG